MRHPPPRVSGPLSSCHLRLQMTVLLKSWVAGPCHDNALAQRGFAVLGRYMLGDSGRSFVVGFGNNPPRPRPSPRGFLSHRERIGVQRPSLRLRQLRPAHPQPEHPLRSPWLEVTLSFPRWQLVQADAGSHDTEHVVVLSGSISALVHSIPTFAR